MKNIKVTFVLTLLALFALSSVAVLAQDKTEVRISW